MKTRLIRLCDKLGVAGLVAAGAAVRTLRRKAPSRKRPRHEHGAAAETWVAIKLVGMGDAVLMLPALAAVRGAGRRLVVITTGRCSEVFEAPGIADEVIAVGRRQMWRQLRKAVRAVRNCVGVLDFEQHVYWSTALGLLAPAAARRFGFRIGSRIRNRGYEVLIDPENAAEPGPRPMKEIFDELARAAGFTPEAELRPLPIGPAAAESVRQWLDDYGLKAGEYLVGAPGSGATVGFRRLPLEAWVEIVRRAPAGMRVVLVGTGVESRLVAAIEERAQREGVTIQLSFSLEQLACLFGQAWTVVATDSGPMHLAAAMGVRVVGIFGPDTPRRYAPYNRVSTSVSLNLPCSPCNNCWVYREAHCTNPDRYACTRRLPAGLVVEAIGARTKSAQYGR